MAEADNKKLVETIFAEAAKGNRALFAESLSDDVVMRVTGSYSWSRTFVGKETLLRELYGYVRSLVEKESRTVPLRFIADGEYVVVEARGDMTTKSGIKYDNEYCLVYRLRNHKIIEIREYCDSTLCEAALGKFPAKEDAQ